MLVEHIRDQDLASLVEELTDPNRPHSCIACTGGHGIGKSILVRQAMHDPSVAANFRRRCWIDCRVPTDTSDFLDILARKMGVPHTESSPSAPEAQLETLVVAIRRLAVVRRVIVLDDLDYLYALDKSFTDAVIKALSSIDQLILVLTTIGWTSAPPPEIGWFLQLKPLSLEMARYLFQSVYPVPLQRDALNKLLARVQGIPQYIMILADLACRSGLQLKDFVQIVDDPQRNFLETRIDHDVKSLEESIRAYPPEDRLDHNALRVIRCLALMPEGVSRDQLQTLVELPTDTFASVCKQISALAYIDSGPENHLVLSRPLREYAIQTSTLDQQTQDILLKKLIALINMKGSLRPGTPDFPQNVQQFKEQKINTENILFTFLDIDSPIAVEAALQFLKPRCAVKPSLKLASKVVEVAERKNMHLLPYALQTEGEARFDSGSFGSTVELLGRAKTIFGTSKYMDDADVVGEMECHIVSSESQSRGDGNMEVWKQAAECARARLSTLTSETGKRGYAHSLLKVADLSGDTKERNLLALEAHAVFEDLGDEYGLTLCDIYTATSLRSVIDLALKFQDFRDFERAAKCYQNAFNSVISSVIRGISGSRVSVENIKVFGIREPIVKVVTHMPQVLNWIKKAIDLYELLGRNLDVAFCRYHLAQLLPPAKAINLYSQAIYQFGCSAFTHHRERGTLDQCYSLVEAEEYSAAISSLENLQHVIGYCGKVFQLRCKELLVECHCRINATRPALQAVRETIKAMEESEDAVGPKLEQYKHLLIALDGQNTPPLIAFGETVDKGRARILVVKKNDSDGKSSTLSAGA
jgi:AAA domain